MSPDRYVRRYPSYITQTTPADQLLIEKAVCESEEKERKWFASYGYGLAQVHAARLAYREFLEKETSEPSGSFYRAPLARKAFMIGWLRNLKV